MQQVAVVELDERLDESTSTRVGPDLGCQPPAARRRLDLPGDGGMLV